MTLEGASLFTLMVSVIDGYETPPLKASARVHVSDERVQAHPVPDIAVAVRPPGNASVTVTVPVVAVEPLLVTVIVYVAPTCPWVKLPACDFVIVRS